MADPAGTPTPTTQSVPQSPQPTGTAPEKTSSGGPPIIAQASGGPPAVAEAAKAPEVDPLEEALRRRPVKVKAGGKERVVSSLAEVEKYVQKGLPITESLQELAEQRAQLEPLAQALQALQSDDPTQAMEVLEGLMGERFVRVAERRLMRELERERATQGMSDRERQMHAELERVKAERAQAAEQARRHEEATRQAEEQRHVSALRTHIQGEVSGALEAVGLPPALSPHAMALVRPLVEASIRAGQPLDREALAGELRQTLTDAVQWAAKGLRGKALLDLFGPEMKSRYRVALLEELRGPAATPRPAQGAQAAATPARVLDFSAPRRW